MPFKSLRQQRYLYAKKPALAKRWQAEYGQPRRLPDRAKRKAKRR